MRFYTTLKLGPNREKTWDGFTIFRNVSVARVGEQVYGANEGIGVKPGPDGLIRIVRKPEEVFRQETLDSGNGKAFVIEHPENQDEFLPDVRPENWRELAHGMMLALRRGTGEQSDEQVADVIVCSEEAVREIDLGLRELSLGYIADYYEIEAGRGEQRNILINHLALVEAGRCGSRCALRDHKPPEITMKQKKGFIDRLVAAARGAKDEDEAKQAIEKLQDEEGGANGDTHIHVHTAAPEAAKADDGEPEDPMEKRFKAIEDSISKLADSMKSTSRDDDPEEIKKREKEEAEKAKKAEDAATEQELEEETGTADARKAQDSALLSEVFETVKMNAEIIAPGVSIPAFDPKANPKAMFRDCVCGLRRKALEQATKDAETAELITAVRGRTLDSAEVPKLSCGQVRMIFNGVAAMKRSANNGAVTRDRMGVVNPASKTGDQVSPMDKFKAASAKRWGSK